MTATKSPRRRTNRLSLHVDGLEARTVMSAMAPLPAAQISSAHADNGLAKHADALHISSFSVNSVSLTDAGQLVANATFSGTVKKHAFSIPTTIPLTLTPATTAAPTAAAGQAAPAAATAVPVLNLSVGPVNLNLLGLNVHLGASCDFNSTAPITVKLTAIPSGTTFQGFQGGLLGDVLGGVANLLNGGTPLGGLGSTLTQLESGLTHLLNGILAGASGVTGGTVGGAGVMTAAATPSVVGNPGGSTSEVLELPLGPINLDLLGALVQTSPICLHITATRGPGNLLGNLLG